MSAAGGEDLDGLRCAVRDWCAEHVPAHWRAEQARASHAEFVQFQQSWLAQLRAAGWAVPHWPAEHGGGFSPAQQAVIFAELARAEAPRLVLHFVSIHHAASTLLHAGTEEQRGRHLPAIMDGEVWCQGFSEPGAGSDLASLTTLARPVAGGYQVTGTKIWSSLAMYADWCLLLARTDPDAPMRKGISYLLMDMRSPGVEVRPIRNASGEEHFCEIFLDDVHIPAQGLVGAENDGWRVAQSTLNTERGATILELAERLHVGFGWLLRLAERVTGEDGRPLAANPAVRERLARLGAEVRALTLLCARSADPDSAAGDAAATASVVKLYYSELLQRLTAYGVELGGLPGQLASRRPLSAGWESGQWLLDFIGSWEWTIPGGSNEIQRTIIGERALGLPREPSAR